MSLCLILLTTGATCRLTASLNGSIIPFAILDVAVQKGLVEVREEDPKKRRQKINKLIHITEKGLGFLEEFRRMKEFTNAFGL